eukprot:352178-Chlamydomonas_euryale.AAC.1
MPPTHRAHQRHASQNLTTCHAVRCTARSFFRNVDTRFEPPRCVAGFQVLGQGKGGATRAAGFQVLGQGKGGATRASGSREG